MAVELAVCEVLLGSPDLALSMLREDERIGLALRWAGGRAGGRQELQPAPCWEARLHWGLSRGSWE